MPVVHPRSQLLAPFGLLEDRDVVNQSGDVYVWGEGLQVRANLCQHLAHGVVSAPGDPVAPSQRLPRPALQILLRASPVLQDVLQVPLGLGDERRPVDGAANVQDQVHVGDLAGEVVQALPRVLLAQRRARRAVAADGQDAHEAHLRGQRLEARHASVEVVLAHVAEEDSVARVRLQALEDKVVGPFGLHGLTDGDGAFLHEHHVLQSPRGQGWRVLILMGRQVHYPADVHDDIAQRLHLHQDDHGRGGHLAHHRPDPHADARVGVEALPEDVVGLREVRVAVDLLLSSVIELLLRHHGELLVPRGLSDGQLVGVAARAGARLRQARRDALAGTQDL
mmetsp:Transcript_42798/g.126788  ORF Transcript_42798/g.126788 Transcript_42798/m.126788 type:complete len:337 (-) Transcript_42798:94-1104(-)